MPPPAGDNGENEGRQAFRWLPSLLRTRRMAFRDYYATLGVERDVDEGALRKAYRALARKYHPDVSEEPDADSRFKAITEAYDVLKDAKKRALYDQYGEHWKAISEGRAAPPGDPHQDFRSAGFDPSDFQGFDGGGGFDPNDMGSVFETFFRQRANRARPGTDVEARIQLGLEEAFAGGKRTIQLGGDNGETRSLEVTIPPGVRSGQRLRLRGEGSPGHNAASGDLYLRIELAPHEVFQLDGDDLVATLTLAPWEAVLGTSVKQKTLTGEVTLKVPAGSTAGRRIRLPGKGYGTEGSRGDLFLEIQIDVPKEIGDEERAAWEALRDASTHRPRGAR